MSMSTASTQIWDQLNVFVKGIRNKLFAKMKKSTFASLLVASTILYSCNHIIYRPLYIINHSVINTDTFKMPDKYNSIPFQKVKKFRGSCNNVVQVCQQVDAYLGKDKKDTYWPDNMYTAKLINDSIWEIEVDYVTRYTKKGTIYGGGALFYIRKNDGKILYLGLSK